MGGIGGDWPNPIRLNVTSTNTVRQGDISSAFVYYQWARPTSEHLSVELFADEDLNPLNGNEHLVKSGTASGTTASQIGGGAIDFTWDPKGTKPGRYSLLLKLTAGQSTRFLYAPEVVEVLPTNPVRLEVRLASTSSLIVRTEGAVGQTVVLEASARLGDWAPIATNTLTAQSWEIQLRGSELGNAMFFRAHSR